MDIDGSDEEANQSELKRLRQELEAVSLPKFLPLQFSSMLLGSIAYGPAIASGGRNDSRTTDGTRSAVQGIPGHC